MSDKTFNLPAKEEMLQALQKVSNEPHLRENFYPLLIRQAGEERVAAGVVMMLVLAIHDYTDGMPVMMAAILNRRVKDYIDALCPDQEIAMEAKVFFDEVNRVKPQTAA